jgi:polar amino acid transport system substrate-binding protein
VSRDSPIRQRRPPLSVAPEGTSLVTCRALTLALTLSLGFVLVVIETPDAQPAPDARVADLVQAGKVRVGIGLAPAIAIKHPATGELRGTGIDLGRALAARIGVQFESVEYPSPPRVLEGLTTGAWDVALLGVDPTRLDQVDFSSPYLQVDYTYLVPAGSSIREVGDADQPGMRIAVTRKSVGDVALTRVLKQAELQRVDTAAAGLEALRAGSVQVLASDRPNLLQLSVELPGSHVLEGRYHSFLLAMVVPKGQLGRQTYVSEFIEDAKTSGLIKEIVDRTGLRGVQIAPAGSKTTR